MSALLCQRYVVGRRFGILQFGSLTSLRPACLCVGSYSVGLHQDSNGNIDAIGGKEKHTAGSDSIVTQFHAHVRQC